MAKHTEQDMHDLTIYDDLITRLATLELILEGIDKITIGINNKIKQLQAEKVHELEFLEEELRIIPLRNRFLGRLNRIKEEIDLRRQTKKKIGNIEKLKEVVVKEWEFQNLEILKDLNYATYDEIDEIEKIVLKLKRLGISKTEAFTSCLTSKEIVIC